MVVPYDMGPINDALASYQAELVSLPQDCHECPQLAHVLPADDRRFLEENSELMLKPANLGDNEEVVPYWDPKLKHNRKAYNGLVQRLQRLGTSLSLLNQHVRSVFSLSGSLRGRS